MQDRVSQYPGRIKLVPVSGQENVYDMEWADGATVEGTPLNKANLLTDATATAIGLNSSATPNTAINQLNSLINSKTNSVNTSLTNRLNKMQWKQIGYADISGKTCIGTTPTYFNVALSMNFNTLDQIAIWCKTGATIGTSSSYPVILSGPGVYISKFSNQEAINLSVYEIVGGSTQYGKAPSFYFESSGNFSFLNPNTLTNTFQYSIQGDDEDWDREMGFESGEIRIYGRQIP